VSVVLQTYLHAGPPVRAGVIIQRDGARHGARAGRGADVLEAGGAGRHGGTTACRGRGCKGARRAPVSRTG